MSIGVLVCLERAKNLNQAEEGSCEGEDRSPT